MIKAFKLRLFLLIVWVVFATAFFMVSSAHSATAPTVNFGAATANGAESVSPASANVSITLPASPTTPPYIVNYTVTGTATGGGTDFTLADGTLGFLAGETSKTLNVNIVDDALIENAETVIITLTVNSNIIIGSTSTFTYTINDNDPLIAFDGGAPSSGAEGDGTVNIPVTLTPTNNTGSAITVDYAVNTGSSTATGGGSDYTLANGTLTFNNGETTKNIALAIVDDLPDEGTETVVIDLSNPSRGTLSAPLSHTFTITDNDPQISFDAATSNGDEGTTPAAIPVSLSAALNGSNVTVDFQVTGGTATGSGTDYTLAAGTLAFTDGGASTLNINIDVVDDTRDEANETITLQILNPAFGATLGSQTTHTYTINDNDLGPLVEFDQSFSKTPDNVGTFSVPVSLAEASDFLGSVHYSVSGGTATGGGTDYTLADGTLTFNAGETTKNISVAITNDSDAEDETVVLILNTPSYPTAAMGRKIYHTLTIQGDSPTVSTPKKYLVFQVFTSAPNITTGILGGPTTTLALKTLMETTLDKLIAKLSYAGDVDTSAPTLGFSIGPMAHDHTDQLINDTIDAAFDTAILKDMAVVFHIHDFLFWKDADDNGDGTGNKFVANLDNTENKDYAGTESGSLDIDYLKSGGTAPPLAPQMCYESPAIKAESLRLAKDVIGAKIKTRFDALAANKKHLFGGVIVGWESNLTDGFCSLGLRGFSAANPPVDFDVERERIVYEYIQLWTKGVFDAGITRDKIYTHIGPIPKKQYDDLKLLNTTAQIRAMTSSTVFRAFWVAFNQFSNPGFSTYPAGDVFNDLDTETQNFGDVAWASAEGTNVELSTVGQSGIDTINWETYLGKMFNNGATLVNIFGFDQSAGEFTTQTEGAEAVAAYQKFLAGTTLVETPITVKTGPTGTPNPVAAGSAVTLSLTINNLLNDTPVYAWSASCPGLGSAGTFDNAAAQNPVWTAPTNSTPSPKSCTLQVDVTNGQGPLQIGTDNVLVNTDNPSIVVESPKVVSPYWQAEGGVYTFLAVSHPSLSGMNSQIGVRMEASNQNGSQQGTLDFTVLAGNTQKVFITVTNFSFNAETNPDDRFLITDSTSSRVGRLAFTDVGSDPLIRLGGTGIPGGGFADIRSLSFWGAIVIANTATGFAMEFIGDMQDSRAFSSANFSGVN